MRTAVIITVYNRSEALRACLQALALEPNGIDEVVVSDDGSDAAHVTAMQRIFTSMPFPVKYVSQPHNGYRLAAARNNAIRTADADYIISIDCDILLLPGAVAAHLKTAARGVFLTANRALLNKEQSAALLASGISREALERAWASADKSGLRKAHRAFVRNTILRKLGLAQRHKPKILGCHFSLFREDIERVNGFDENFIGWGLEDDDFSARLHLAGVNGRSLIREARALHLWHPPAESAPESVLESPNAAYFRRPDLRARCEKGLYH